MILMFSPSWAEPHRRLVPNIPLRPRQFLTLPELQFNPFVEQICKVFSSRGNGDLSFEDFLDMMSVFR